jgi:hypothetical protein
VIQPDDPWGFEEEPVETWADILGAQAWDLVWLSAFLLLAVISFRRRSVPLKYLTLVLAVGYMGFVKSHLISVTNIFSLIDGNLPVASRSSNTTSRSTCLPRSRSCRPSWSGDSIAAASARLARSHS